MAFEITEEATSAAKNLLKMLKEEGISYGRYGLISKQGKVWFRKDDSCFRNFSDTSTHDFTFKPVLFATYPAGSVPRKSKRNIRYINWLLNDSFMAKVFLTKDPEEVFLNGAIMSCNFSPKELVIAGVMLRYVYEQPQIIDVWGLLNEEFGFSEETAAIFSHMFMKNTDGNWTPCYLSSGHAWLDSAYFMYSSSMRKYMYVPACGISGVKNLINNTLPILKERVYDRNFTYFPFGLCFTKDYDKIKREYSRYDSISSVTFRGKDFSKNFPSFCFHLPEMNLPNPSKWSSNNVLYVLKENAKEFFAEFLSENLKILGQNEEVNNE